MNILGIAFIAIGVIILLIDVINKVKCKEMVTGTVVDIYKITSINGSGGKRRTYYPIYQYNVDGTMYVKKSSSGSIFCRYQIGDEVKIKYNPKNPNTYHVKGKITNIVMSIIWIMLGVGIIIIGQRV